MQRSVLYGAILLFAGTDLPLHAQFAGPDAMLCPNCAFPLTADMDLIPDGKIDLVLTAPFATMITWMKGHGDGTFDPPIFLANNDHHLSIDLIGDADDDGDIDLVGMTRSDLYGDSVLALLRNESGTFVTEVIDQPMSGTHPPDQFADIDGDGTIDFLSITGALDVWHRNMGDGTYARQIISRWCQPVLGPYAALDIEGDGDMDLVNHSTTYGRLIVHWNIGNGRFGPFTFASPFLATFGDGFPIGVTELNNDGLMDLVVGGRPCPSLGDGTFDLQGSPLPYLYQSIGNVDCQPGSEAVLSSPSIQGIYVRALNSAGIIAVMPQDPFIPVRTALADLNGDGLKDLLVGPTFGTGLITWRNNNSVPPEVTFDIPATVDTLDVDTAFRLTGGSPVNGGGYYEGTGVFNDTIYTEQLAFGWNIITYHHSSFLNSTHCQSSAVDSIYFIPGTGISDPEQDSMLLYPVPADDGLVIRSKAVQADRITVHDMLGQVVTPPGSSSPGVPREITINTSSLANGTYRLTLFRDGIRCGGATFIVQH